MHLKWFVILALAAEVFPEGNNIVRDYFVYKNVPSVVAFSCADVEHDAQLTKMLNSEAISVSIMKLTVQFDMRRLMAVTYWRLGVLLDLACERQNIFVLSESSKYGMYNESYNWLLLGKNLSQNSRALNDSSFSMVTDLVIATTASHGYVLYDVYNPAKERSGKLNVTKLGYWLQNNGLSITLTQEKYQRRANLHGMKLKVISITHYRPSNSSVEDYLQDYTTKSQDSMSKFGYSILLHMADLFNFTMEIAETTMWDTVEKNGTHIGMLAMLQRNEGDLGASPGAMTVNRANMARLIGPAWPFRTSFMFRSMSRKIRNEFLRPLNPGSWYAIILVAVLAICVLMLAFLLEFVNDWAKQCETAVFVTIGIFCQQGSAVVPEHLGGRITFLHLLLFSLLIYNYYSASVVSARLNEPPDKMNDSLNELAKSSLKIAAERIAYTNWLLTSSTDWEVRSFYNKRWAKLDDSKKYMSLEEGMRLVTQGGFAYHTDPDTGYPYIERLFDGKMICEFTEVHLFRPQQMALWGRHNSPFTKMAKISLTKMYGFGLRSRQVKRWASRKPKCLREVTSVQSFSLLEAAPALFILFTGMILASGICISEIIFFRWWRSRLPKFKMAIKNITKGKTKNMKKLENLRLFKIRKEGIRIKPDSEF